MAEVSDRATEIIRFEREAEMLVAEQLDLIVQLEVQLRAIHLTMRQIEKLRSPEYRVGPALTNGERRQALTSLTNELNILEEHLETERGSCLEMHQTIERMRVRLKALRHLAHGHQASHEAAAGEDDSSGLQG